MQYFFINIENFPVETRLIASLQIHNQLHTWIIRFVYETPLDSNFRIKIPCGILFIGISNMPPMLLYFAE